MRPHKKFFCLICGAHLASGIWRRNHDACALCGAQNDKDAAVPIRSWQTLAQKNWRHGPFLYLVRFPGGKCEIVTEQEICERGYTKKMVVKRSRKREILERICPSATAEKKAPTDPALVLIRHHTGEFLIVRENRAVAKASKILARSYDYTQLERQRAKARYYYDTEPKS
jgi:hypothetical protein